MMKKKIIIHKIISGGQSGVDRSALDFSIKHKIPYGGWCPRNRWAEDGKIPLFYNLTETKEEEKEFRTLKNVIGSDGTLIIYKGLMDEGTLKTIFFCKQHNKTFIEFDLLKNIDKAQFKNWTHTNLIRVLNVAGPRESNCPGIYNETSTLLEYLFLD